MYWIPSVQMSHQYSDHFMLPALTSKTTIFFYLWLLLFTLLYKFFFSFSIYHSLKHGCHELQSQYNIFEKTKPNFLPICKISIYRINELNQ